MPLTFCRGVRGAALSVGALLPFSDSAEGNDRFQPYLVIQTSGPASGSEVIFDGPGDVDGDGRDDLLLTWNVTPAQPLVRVRSGLNGSLLFQLTPQPYPGGFLGIGGIGGNTVDFDGDGHGELVLVRAGMSMVQVRSGSDGSLMFALTPDMFGWSPSGFGGSIGAGLAAPGDVDGDGFPDLMLRGAAAASCAGVVVLAGPTLNMLYQHVGTCGYTFGDSMGGLQDVSGDGYADYFIGQGGSYLTPNLGWLGVYSGTTGQLVTTFTGSQVGQTVGIAACALDDIDGDGSPEIASSEFWPGSGSPPGTPPRIEVRTVGSFGSLYTVMGLGGVLQPLQDADGDGQPEILAWRQSFTTVLSGANGAVLFSHTPPPGFLPSFLNATALGDVNGDGLGDFGEARRPVPWAPLAPAAAQELTWGTITSTIQTESWIFVARNLEVFGPTAVGGNAQFDVLAPKHAGKSFQIVLSMQGSIPGVPFGPFLLPVVPDTLFYASYAAGIAGVLGANGMGSVAVPIPPAPLLQGLELVASGVVYDPAGPLGIGCVLTGAALRIQ